MPPGEPFPPKAPLFCPIRGTPATYLMSGAAHDRWEDSTGGIVPGETGLAHTGTIVNNKRGNIIIHGWLWEKRREGDMSITGHTPATEPRPRSGRQGREGDAAKAFPTHFLPAGAAPLRPAPARGCDAFQSSALHGFGTKEVPAPSRIITIKGNG